MCPACIGSAILLFTGATSTGGLAALVAGKALHRPRAGRAERDRPHFPAADHPDPARAGRAPPSSFSAG